MLAFTTEEFCCRWGHIPISSVFKEKIDFWKHLGGVQSFWKFFCDQSPRLTDGSSGHRQKLGHDQHSEALFEKKGQRLFPSKKPVEVPTMWDFHHLKQKIFSRCQPLKNWWLNLVVLIRDGNSLFFAFRCDEHVADVRGTWKLIKYGTYRFRSQSGRLNQLSF